MKQYVVQAAFCRNLRIGYLVSARTAADAREKLRLHLDHNGDSDRWIVRQARVATERDIEIFNQHPQSVLS